MASLRRRRQPSSSPGPALIIGIAVLLLALVAGWFWLRSDRDPAPPPETTLPAERPVPAEAGPEVPPLDLPDLPASDEFVRELVTRLSEHPQLAAWLATDELIHRFVRVVLDLAGGSNPAEHVRFMTPAEPFTVEERDGHVVATQASMRRYNLLAATFASLDTQGTVRLYRQLRPLIDEAFEELGAPGESFDDAMEQAIRNLMEADVPDRPLALEQDEAVHVYMDSDLESRRGAEKALIRMGPENARLIQGKLAEFAVALRLAR